jgi:acylphosphatase
MPERVRLRATVHGFVQGVSFRYYTLRRAQSLNLDGYVRNRPDGSVQVVAEGDREAVSQLLTWLHAGPPSAAVEKVDYEWQEPSGELRHFEVRL